MHVCQGSCGGFWFPLSQVRKLEHVKPGAGSEFLLFEKADGVKIYRGAEHPCPQCQTTLLYRHFFSKKYDTEVNQCSKCSGFWIDVGGLIDLIKTSKKGKDELVENYFTFIMDEKVSEMNLANEDIEEAAKWIKIILSFLTP